MQHIIKALLKGDLIYKTLYCQKYFCTTIYTKERTCMLSSY